MTEHKSLISLIEEYQNKPLRMPYEDIGKYSVIEIERAVNHAIKNDWFLIVTLLLHYFPMGQDTLKSKIIRADAVESYKSLYGHSKNVTSPDIREQYTYDGIYALQCESKNIYAYITEMYPDVPNTCIRY